MGACASLPSFTTTSQQNFISDESFECAVFSTQGRRPRMEDAHVTCLSLPSHPQYSLFGVFDGFNGDDASSYFSQNIVNTVDTLHNLEYNDAIIHAIESMDADYIHSEKTAVNEYAYDPAAGCTFVFALVHKSHKADASMTTLLTAESPNTPSTCSYPNEYESLKYGSCEDESATTRFGQKGYRVRVFWAGDSRAVLMSDSSQFHKLTEDHHCTLAKEAERIKNAKGTIINERVDGICEVTRCFGCNAMKNDASLAMNKQKMISVAECTTLICKENDRLLIFCDGLLKKWSDRQLYARCKHHVEQHESEKEGALCALKYLCEQAIDEGSNDNITILSVKFK